MNRDEFFARSTDSAPPASCGGPSPIP